MGTLTIHAREEIATGFLLTMFFVWVTVSLVIGLAKSRPRNHRLRMRARAHRRATAAS